MCAMCIAPEMVEEISLKIRARVYQRPQIVKETGMRFPLDLIESTAEGVVCHQCSSCHGCR